MRWPTPYYLRPGEQRRKVFHGQAQSGLLPVGLLALKGRPWQTSRGMKSPRRRMSDSSPQGVGWKPGRARSQRTNAFWQVNVQNFRAEGCAGIALNGGPPSSFQVGTPSSDPTGGIPLRAPTTGAQSLCLCSSGYLEIAGTSRTRPAPWSQRPQAAERQ